MNMMNRAAGSPPVKEEFKWPAPPYLEFLPGQDEPSRKQCLVVLAGGQKLQGELLHFDPDAAIMDLDIPGGSAPEFDQVLQLRLPRPVRLTRQELPPEFAKENIFAVSERQPFSIEMHDGEIFSGETRGCVNAQCGLFLFPPAGMDQVTRYFVPARRIKDFHIGDPIGQILIDHRIATKGAVAAAVARQRELRVQKLGDLMTVNQIVSADELAAALARQERGPISKLGEVLIEMGLLSDEELGNALKEQERNRKVPLGQLLIDMGVINQDGIRAALAIKLGIPFVNLRKFLIPAELLKKVPETLARRLTVIPIFQMDATLVVAVENPLATAMLEELRFSSGMKVLPVIASEGDIRAAIQKNYGAAEYSDHYSPYSSDGSLEFSTQDSSKPNVSFHPEAAGATRIDDLASQLATEGDEIELADDQVVESDTTLVRLINKMILDAYRQGASDIHVESYPGNKNIRIRFRKDGAMFKYLELPSKFRSAMVSRIKIMSTLDISERRKPQDGKIDFSRFGPVNLELRVATVPTNNGLEDVVMRLLSATKALQIDQLGFSEDVLRNLQRMVTKPHGLCLVCGPTGSGKTTTLHALLGYINTGERKIWTAEDPIEITQEGLRQVQVNTKVDWTFAAAMRTFLRADPDVIMVGEMRDAETAKVGIEASLTGHLVLSTLHTNSAPESVVRLLDLGMDPFNFADALLFILAQRLVRCLCPACKKPYMPGMTELDALLREYCLDGSLEADKVLVSWQEHYGDPQGNIILYRASGCDECGNTGYRGRVGLYELLLTDASVRRLIQTRGAVSEIKAVAIAAGMRTLIQNGIEKILQGVSDMPQVRAVCG